MDFGNHVLFLLLVIEVVSSRWAKGNIPYKASVILLRKKGTSARMLTVFSLCPFHYLSYLFAGYL